MRLKDEHLQPVQPILVPSNLGLKPLIRGHQPGAWLAPRVLLDAGILNGVTAYPPNELGRPTYDFSRQAGTSIRNGNTLRSYSLVLAGVVSESLLTGAVPVVIGGDCSVLLGCLLGARHAGACGLVHVDGHSDFYHPGCYDPERTLGTAAGMDLALATGRGEPLLTQWPGGIDRLVDDHAIVQVGDRDAGTEEDYLPSTIRRIDVHEALDLGADEVGRRALAHLERHGMDRIWIHVDLDVLDEDVMPAVDLPGSPGFDFHYLTKLLEVLVSDPAVIGVNFTIYDPEEDPTGQYATGIAQAVSIALQRAQRGREQSSPVERALRAHGHD